MKRRIGGAGGGSDPAPKKGGPFFAATALAVSMAVAGGGIGTGTATLGTTSSTGAANSAAGQTLKVRKFDGKRAARKGNVKETWRRMGMRRLREETDNQIDCLAYSFGEVREFFLKNPCRSLSRRLYGVGDGTGNIAAVSVSAVTMGSRAQARKFKRVIDPHGTGDITPVGGPLLESYNIRFSGHNYDSRSRGRTIVAAETETVSGHFSPESLEAIAEVAVLLPPPKR